jgi:hypothetical protein
MPSRKTPAPIAWRRQAGRCLSATLLLTAGLSLSSCVSLFAKAPGKPEADAIAVTEAEKATPTPAPTIAQRKTPPRAGLYVDPMLASASSPAAPPARTPSAQPPRAGAQPQANASSLAATAAPVAAEPSNFGELVTQPTAVQAGHNSIYALANAQVAAAEGVPSYAPVRNINPVAGSVFSARATPASTAIPVNGETAGSSAKDGLW